MTKVTTDELNNAAMQIILCAGNCRNLLSEVIQDTENSVDVALVNEKLKQAKEEITSAHKIQTSMIQQTIEDEEVRTTLLFTHAQDTLMTINSEVNMCNYIIRLYRKLEEKLVSL